VQAQSPELICHRPRADRRGIAPRQGGEVLAQVGGTEALRELSEQDEGVQERVRARIGKTQARGALAPGRHRAIDGSESIFAEHAIVAQALDFDQSAVGRKADLAQLWKVMQALPILKS
jgi:hypothetical protein